MPQRVYSQSARAPAARALKPRIQATASETRVATPIIGSLLF
jgi:hypothetical protein